MYFKKRVNLLDFLVEQSIFLQKIKAVLNIKEDKAVRDDTKDGIGLAPKPEMILKMDIYANHRLI